MKRPLLVRLALVLLSALGALLAVEGALRLGGASLYRRRPVDWVAELPVHVASEAEREGAAARSAGPFRVHEDPEVGFTFKRASEVRFAGRRFRTDALGLREEPEAAATREVFRIVLLGGDLAFSPGASVEDSLAARLQHFFAQHQAPGAVPIVVRTVAVPGWTGANARRFLADHLAELDPDLVLFLLEPDLLADAWGVDEDGFLEPRPVTGSPVPLATLRAPGAFEACVDVQAARAWTGADEAWSLALGLGRTARARLAREGEHWARLATRLAARGAALVLGGRQACSSAGLLRAELSSRGREVPEVFVDLPPSSYPGTEHDETNLALGLLETAPGSSLEAVRASVREDVAPGLARHWESLATGEVVQARTQAWLAAEAALTARIEPASGRGRSQILGGVLGQDRLGPQGLFLLPRGGELVVELAGLVAAPGLYPLAIEVRVEGETRGEVVLAGPGKDARFTCELALDGGVFEVELRAHDWGRLALGERQEPCAARLVALEVRP